MNVTSVRHLAGSSALMAAATVLVTTNVAMSHFQNYPDTFAWMVLVTVAARTAGSVTATLQTSVDGTTYVSTTSTTGAISANGVSYIRGTSIPRYARIQLVPSGGPAFDGTVALTLRFGRPDDGEDFAPGLNDLPTGAGANRVLDNANMVAQITTILGNGLEFNGGLLRVKLPAASGITRDVTGIYVTPDPADGTIAVNAGGVRVAAASITPAHLNAALYTTDAFEATVALTKAQILALKATPIKVVDAPGAGKMIEVINWRMFKAAGAYDAPTAAGDDFGLLNNATSNTTRLEATGFLNAGAGQRFANGVGSAVDAVLGIDASVFDNQPLNIANIGANEFTDGGGTGSATVTVKVRYRILDIA